MTGERPPRSVARGLAHVTFAAFLVLVLATPSWRVGPFTWGPVLRFPMLAGRPADLGLPSLLPVLIVAGWLAARLLDSPHRPWQWGRAGITLPLLGLTFLILAGLDPAPTWRTAVQIGGVGLTWLTYLFIRNEKPPLTVPLALVTLVQGSVALGQFLCQRDLGLAALGELPLDPAVSGISVLWARDQRWLRAYGLTGHPNFLGATLAVLLLLLLRELDRARGWHKAGLTAIVSVGLLGLLASFSRASWLALAAGLSAWAIRKVRSKFRSTNRQGQKGAQGRCSISNLPLHLILPLIVGVSFVFLYRDLVISRFVNLDTRIEARSLNDRGRDASLALELVAAHPWRGVGAGNYLPGVRSFEPDSRVVHNVPLLVAAELGLPGAALWAWLSLSGLRSSRAVLPAWLATLLIGLFDVSLWMTANWRAAVIYGILLGLSGGWMTTPQ